jgi:S-adenosylmethionine-diacylglycerol 3-amino-3-carboxypropyl transferase
LSDIANRASFDFVRYANCWEDTDILLEALQIQKGDRCLSIASSGDNSLSMLVHDPEIVVAFDLNPTQLACLELRIAAFKHLSYTKVLELLGVRESTAQNRLFSTIQKSLSPDAADYFEKNWDEIGGEIVSFGKFEQYFSLFRTKVLPLIHRKQTIHELLQEKDIKARERFYEKKWNTFRYRLLFQIFFSKFVMGKLGRDPAFFSHAKGDLAKRLLKRVEHAVVTLPTHTNPYLNFIMTGNFTNAALPHYLREENFTKIKDNIDRISLFHGDLSQVCESWEEGFDAFNLSDIFEYMSINLTEEAFSILEQSSRGSARIAFWNMMVDRFIPEKSRFSIDSALSEKLFCKDNAFFYKRFIVGQI